MWGPIIGAGISALGSLFGGKDDEETTTRVNYSAMARSAERAGFNPLTAIRNGGSAGFTTTHHPGLSMSDRFGQAFQTIGNAIMSFDARADERAELEQQLLRAQIGQINRQGGASQRLWSMDVPSAAGSTRSTKAVSGGAGGGFGPGGMVMTGGPATRLAAPFIDEYGNELPGPGPDTPDAETIITAPLLRLQKKYLEGWEKLYGPNSAGESQRTWRKVGDWATSGPGVPEILKPYLSGSPGAKTGGRGNTRYTPPALRKPAPFSPFWGK